MAGAWQHPTLSHFADLTGRRPGGGSILAERLMDDLRLWLPLVAFAISLYALSAKWQEKPRLRVRLAEPVVSEGEQDGVRWRFVHVAVENPQLPWVFRWLTYRQPARNTRLELAYFATGGTQPKFAFAGRWSANPEPVQQRLVDGRDQQVFDPWLVHLGRFRDISSGDRAQDVAVAIKVAGDEYCYGFTNESYREGNVWRLAEYRLPKGHYSVEALAVSGEIRSRPVRFTLRNDGPALTDLWLDVPH